MEVISYRADEDMFWVGCSKEEAEMFFLPILDQKGIEEYKQIIEREALRTPDDIKNYHKMVCKAMNIKKVSYAYFCVSRNHKMCYPEVAHHPFHQMWNAYSPFMNCKPTTISILDIDPGMREALLNYFIDVAYSDKTFKQEEISLIYNFGSLIKFSTEEISKAMGIKIREHLVPNASVLG